MVERLNRQNVENGSVQVRLIEEDGGILAVEVPINKQQHEKTDENEETYSDRSKNKI